MKKPTATALTILAWIVGAVGAACCLGSAAPAAADPPTARPTMNDLVLASDAQRPGAGELRALLAATCGAADVRAGGPGEPPRCAVVVGYPTPCDGLQINVAVAGHLTAATADEVLADYDGCEPHAANFGGSVLLRRSAGAWRRVSFIPGLRTDRCLRFTRSDRRDVLVCFATWSGQGFEEATLDLVTFGNDGGASSAKLLDFHGILQSFLACAADRLGQTHRLSILTGWRRLAGTSPGLEVRRRDEAFTTPGFCTNRNDEEAAAKGIYERLQAFRDAHARAAVLTFQWRGDRMVRGN